MSQHILFMPQQRRVWKQPLNSVRHHKVLHLNYVDDYIFLKSPSKVTMYENVLESNTNDSNRINNGSYVFGNVLMYAKHCARYLRGFYHSKEGALFNIPILQMGKIKLRRVK